MRSPRAVAAAVFAAVVLAFLPAVGADFVDWDDVVVLLENPRFRGLGPAQLRWMWANIYFAHYMPLTWMSFGLDFTLWGMNPVGYHLGNVLLHAAAAAAFLGLARELLARAAPKEAGTLRLEAAAAFAALAWALHPLRVESVAWASQRRDPLSALFYILSLRAYLRGRLGASWVHFVLSLLSKEIGLTLPLVLCALDVYPLRRRPAWREKVPFFSAGLAAALVGFWGELEVGAVTSLGGFGVPERLAQSAYAFLFYLWKTAWPAGLQFLYLPPRPFRPFSPGFIACEAAAAALLWAAWSRRRVWPATSAAVAAYLAQLLPVIGLAKFGAHIAADRFAYLPGLSLAALAGGGLLAAQRRLAGPARRVLNLSAGALLAAWATLSWRQCGFWDGSDALWGRALAVSPGHPTALNNLGVLAAKRGDDARAQALLRRSLASRPDQVLALDNLGGLLARVGSPREAAALLRRALEKAPGKPALHAHLGLAFSRDGRPREAEAAYRTALRLKPSLKEASFNLGVLLEGQGRAREAEAAYRAALAAGAPDHPDAANNLGLLLSRRGRYEEALGLYARSIRSGGPSWRAHYNWGIALAELGRLDGSERHYREALRLAPERVDIRFNLGNTLARARRWREAAREYSSVLERDPGHALAARYLRVVEGMGRR